MYFIKWVSAFFLWLVGVATIPGLIAGILFLPFQLGFSAIASLCCSEGSVFIGVLAGIYGFIFLLIGYYIYIYFSEKIISKFLNSPYLNLRQPLGIKAVFSDIKNKPKVRSRFIVCNIILVMWAVASIFIGNVKTPAFQQVLFFTYYFFSLFIVLGTLIYFSTSLREKNNAQI